MKKLFYISFCFTFLSCFTEPKKENNNANLDLQINSIKSADKAKDTTLDSSTIKEKDTLLKKDIEEQISFANDEDKNRLNIIDNLNEILKSAKTKNEIKLSFLNEKRNLMLFFKYEFSLDNVYAVYVNKDYNDGFGNYHIFIECQKNNNDSNCMYDTVNSEYVSGYGFPLKTEEDCLSFVRLFNKLH